MKQRIGIVGVAFVVACGQSANSNDGGVDGSADAIVTPDVNTSDAPLDASTPSCDLAKPFGAPARVTKLDTAENDLFARLTHDELNIYFEKYPSADSGVGGSDLYLATRASMTGPFGAPALLGSLHAPANQFDPTPTGDNLTLYFTSTRTGGSGLADLWMSTRANAMTAFSAPTNVTSLNTPNNEHTPYVMADGLTLYFCEEGGVAAIARATRTSSTPFALDAPTALAQVNGSGDSIAPVVSPDELTIYFGSNRSGTQGPFGIWKATRASTSDAFGNVMNVTELDTASSDIPTWISDDGCRMYLYNDSAGSFDIYLATKPQ